MNFRHLLDCDTVVFHGFSAILNEGSPIWNARSNYMENSVKLFSQVCVAQSFQVNIG